MASCRPQKAEGPGSEDLSGQLRWLLSRAEGARQVREAEGAGVGGPLLHSVHEDRRKWEGDHLQGVGCEGDLRRQHVDLHGGKGSWYGGVPDHQEAQVWMAHLGPGSGCLFGQLWLLRSWSPWFLKHSLTKKICTEMP